MGSMFHFLSINKKLFNKQNLFQNYALTLATQLGVRGRPKGELGAPIDEEMLDKFRDEQLVQLYELMLAAKTLDEEKKSAKDK